MPSSPQHHQADHHHHHHHHTLPSAGTRRHSFGHWRQFGQDRKGGSSKKSSGSIVLNPTVGPVTATTASDEAPQMMAPRPPPLFANKHGRGGAAKTRRGGK